MKRSVLSQHGGRRFGRVLLGSFVAMTISAVAETNRLALKAAMQTALAQSPSLEQAQARIDQSAARLRQTKSAYWPDVELPASYMHQVYSDSSTIGALSQESATEYYRLGLAASWVLFDGFARRNRALSAEQAEARAASAFEDTQRLLLGGVASAFYVAQLARENVRIALADEVFNQRLLSEARTRLKAGAGSRSDVLSLEVRMNAASSEVIRQQEQLRVARANLAETMGQADADLPLGMPLAELDETLVLPEVQTNITGLINRARQLRPDLRAARLGRESVAFSLKAASRARWPTLGVGGSLDGERQDDTSFKSGDFGNTVSLNVNYTFSDGGQRRARVHELHAMVQEGDAVARAIGIRVALDIRQTHARVEGAQARLVLQERNAATVAENRDLVEREYRAGNTSLVRLNEAQRDLVSALGQLAQARVAFQQAQVDRLVATGEILRFVQVGKTP